ncbi:MAG: hypothetical protein J6B16_03710 [Clostridia bacterium]|nr:hypothetical protein [Clostridia bacterium]
MFEVSNVFYKEVSTLISTNPAFDAIVLNLGYNDVHYNEDGYKKFAKHLLSFIKN